MSKTKGIVLSYEAADQVTLASLQDHREYLKKELKKHKKNPKTDKNPDGYWLHPDDVVKHKQLITAMDQLINYYGGE